MPAAVDRVDIFRACAIFSSEWLTKAPDLRSDSLYASSEGADP